MLYVYYLFVMVWTFRFVGVYSSVSDCAPFFPLLFIQYNSPILEFLSSVKVLLSSNWADTSYTRIYDRWGLVTISFHGPAITTTTATSHRRIWRSHVRSTNFDTIVKIQTKRIHLCVWMIALYCVTAIILLLFHILSQLEIATILWMARYYTMKYWKSHFSLHLRRNRLNHHRRNWNNTSITFQFQPFTTWHISRYSNIVKSADRSLFLTKNTCNHSLSMPHTTHT